jgi:hypothetical protein
VDVESLKTYLILQDMTDDQQETILSSVRAANEKAKQLKKERISQNVGLVVDALKKIESDIRARYDDLGNKIETRVNSIQDGRDGSDGRDGKDGKDGRPGRDGLPGPMGPAGRDGRDGIDGEDGVSVIGAKIDFDGSLVITLSNGREINVGEVVAPDLAERIKVITNGGGTSQTVLDTLASLQTQINNLIPSQTGNAGKFLTTNGSVLSWASVAGGLSYQGTWNASTNTPTLASGVGTNGYYYVVATAGSTNLDGITDWQIGDWLLFNGTAWQKIDQSDLVTSVNGQTGAVTITAAGLGALTSVASADASVTVSTAGTAVDLAVYSAPRLIAQVRNETGSTLTKGTVVYISGASGNKATVSKAIATSDATSAQTFGLITADLATNTNGYAILAGEIAGLDTSAFAAGAQLYLSSTTAGAYTSTKQYAPNHLVYVGVVTRSHVNQGTIEVRIQNGYEMDELHNVSAQSPSNGQVLIYNASTSLWEKNTLTDGTGITITEGAGSITITNSAPDQTVALTAGTGISTSGTYPNFTINNTGVTSLTGTTNQVSVSGSTGSVTLSLPSSINVNLNGTVGASTPNTGAFTTLSASSTVSGTGFSTYLASPPAIGGTAPAAGSFTTLSATGVTTVQAGTAAAPAITTSGDTNTGIYFPSADTVGITAGGTQVGSVGLGTTLALQGATSQSGTGITFPATQSASTNANTLDDYEEGTWTPTANNVTVTGTVTYSGWYVKVGRLVYLGMKITLGSGATFASTLNSSYFGGLPFTVSNNEQGVGGMSSNGIQNFGMCVVYNSPVLYIATSSMTAGGSGSGWISVTYTTST